MNHSDLSCMLLRPGFLLPWFSAPAGPLHITPLPQALAVQHSEIANFYEFSSWIRLTMPGCRSLTTSKSIYYLRKAVSERGRLAVVFL